METEVWQPCLSDWGEQHQR